MRNNEEAVQRDDKWFLKTIEQAAVDGGMREIYQGYCNALEERPLLTGYQDSDALLNIKGRNVPNVRLETEIGPLRGIKMLGETNSMMILAPFEEANISKEAGRLALIKSAYISVPVIPEHLTKHIGHFANALAAGTEMLRHVTIHHPKYFHFRFTHPNMGLPEPDGFCFLFRMDNQSQYYIFLSENGAILTLARSKCEAIISMSPDEVDSALQGFYARTSDGMSLNKPTEKTEQSKPKPETKYSEFETLLPEPLDDPLPPVMIRRLAPNPDTSWPKSTSWLGGLPRLGEVPWPINKKGHPLHHLASISLAELAPLLPHDMVSDKGQLSFFVGPSQGENDQARVLLTTGTSDSVLPASMPPLIETFGSSERSKPARLDRYPIKLTSEPWHNINQDKSTLEAFKVWKADFDGGRAPIYWDSAYKLLYGMKSALDEGRIAQSIELHIKLVDSWQKRLDEASTEQAGEYPRKNLGNHRLTLDALTRKLDDYSLFVSEVEEKVLLHDRWNEISNTDVEWLRDKFAQLVFSDYSRPEQNTTFGAIYKVGSSRLHNLEQAVASTYDCIVHMPASVICELPSEILELIGYKPGFAPIQGRHQMFGIGIDIQGDLAFYANHYLLLQIEYDRGAGLQIGDCGAIQFMIHPDDLDAQDWDSVKIIFAGN